MAFRLPSGFRLDRDAPSSFPTATPGPSAPVRSAIIHIGFHKAGSTAIQHWCARNSEHLRENGLVYPTDGLRWGGHHPVPWSLGVKHPLASPDFEPREYLDGIDAGDGTILLSSEDFEFLNPPGIKALRELLRSFEVRIVAVLRNIADYLVADYQQNVRSGDVRCPFSLLEFCLVHNIYHRMDYFRILSQWAGVFGWSSIELIAYPPRGTSVLDGFLATIGVPDPGTALLERPNSSLSPISVRTLQHVNKHHAPRDRDKLVDQLYEMERPTDGAVSLVDPVVMDRFLRHQVARVRRIEDHRSFDTGALVANPMSGKRVIEPDDWDERYAALADRFDLGPAGRNGRVGA